VDSGTPEPGIGKRETGDWKPETGNRDNYELKIMNDESELQKQNPERNALAAWHR
jgi:hypothetical protein